MFNDITLSLRCFLGLNALYIQILFFKVSLLIFPYLVLFSSCLISRTTAFFGFSPDYLDNFDSD